MDSKTFISRLSKATGLDHHKVSELTAALTTVIAETGAELDSAAIPGFGTFKTEKTDEYIETSDTGRRTLVPPAINLHFVASVVLRKKLIR